MEGIQVAAEEDARQAEIDELVRTANEPPPGTPEYGKEDPGLRDWAAERVDLYEDALQRGMKDDEIYAQYGISEDDYSDALEMRRTGRFPRDRENGEPEELADRRDAGS